MSSGIGASTCGVGAEPIEPHSPLLSPCLEGTDGRPKEIQGKYILVSASSFSLVLDHNSGKAVY